MKKMRLPCRPASPGDIIKITPVGKPTEFYLICAVRESTEPGKVTYVVLGNGRVSKIHNAKKLWSNENSIIRLSDTIEQL